MSAEEVAHGKPEPDVFLETARRMRAEPARCVVLEDAPPGAAAARAAGMRCIAIPYVPATAADPAFKAADLLFAGGQSAFSAEAAYGWLRGQSAFSAEAAYGWLRGQSAFSAEAAYGWLRGEAGPRTGS